MKTQQIETKTIAQLLEQVYFSGIYTGDVLLLKTIYHPGTLLFGDVKGQPYAKTLREYLEGVAHRQSPKDSGKPFKGEILNISVVNSIAIAEVKVTMYDFVYHEFLSFHKIDGQWLLVNKMISDTAELVVGKDSSNEKVSLIATLHILPGFEREVKDALYTLAIATNKEAGVEQFVVNTSNDSPQTVVVYEVYKSEEAFELHKSLPHAVSFFALVKGKIENDKIELVFLTELNGVK